MKKDIRFNKMTKSLSITKGSISIFLDINEVTAFILGNKNVGLFNQIGDTKKKKKGIMFTKLPNNRLLIEQGMSKIGYICLKDCKDYFENHILDIKDFKQINNY